MTRSRSTSVASQIIKCESLILIKPLGLSSILYGYLANNKYGNPGRSVAAARGNIQSNLT